MTDQQLHDDLAFMRSIVEGGEDSQRLFGQVYFVAGLCYSGQLLLSGAQTLGWIPAESALDLVIGLGPTILFLVLLAWLVVRGRSQSVPASRVSRATGIVFGAVGLTNLALVAAIGAVALRERSLLIWFIYPCVVMILQGLAWSVAWALRRRGWFGLVAAGWFAIGIGMALAIETTGLYVLFAGIGMVGLMALPGALLMRTPHSAA